MKIHIEPRPQILFCDLECGDIFEWEGNHYIKAEIIDTDNDKLGTAAIDLETGETAWIYQKEEVRLCKFEMTIKN